jgi:hypothetical protein
MGRPSEMEEITVLLDWASPLFACRLLALLNRS